MVVAFSKFELKLRENWLMHLLQFFFMFGPLVFIRSQMMKEKMSTLDISFHPMF